MDEHIAMTPEELESARKSINWPAGEELEKEIEDPIHIVITEEYRGGEWKVKRYKAFRWEDLAEEYVEEMDNKMNNREPQEGSKRWRIEESEFIE